MEFTYNWDSYPRVIDYLNKIYINNINYLLNNGYDLEYAKEFIKDIEDYLYYFKIKKYNVNIIIDKINDIDNIEFYDSLYVNNNTNHEETILPVLNRGTRILLSTYISGDNRLSAKERRKLYIYQGLSHSVISLKNKKTLLFSKKYNRYLDGVYITENIVNNGWLLLEDTLSQELAEKITYCTLNKIRPGYKPGLENEEYPISDYKISSNLEMYRMFQELIIKFGLTINKIGNIVNYSDKSIMNDMLKYSINNDFSSIVIDQYNQDNLSLELYQLLYLMGLLINEKYRIYHMNFINNKLTTQEIDEIYDRIVKLTKTLISFNDNQNTKEDTSNIIILYDNKVKEKIKKLIKNNEV